MIREAVLIRKDEQVFEYFEKCVTLAGIEKREEVLETFDKIQLLLPYWGIMTCPVMHPDLHYASQNCTFILGYPNEYLKKHSLIAKYLLHVHEHDQQDLFECFSFMHEHTQATPSIEHHAHRSVFYYRYRKGNGEYIQLQCEMACLRLGESGNFYFALFRDISERPFTGVKVEIYLQEELLKKIKEYKPSARPNLLSKREQELVTLIRQGLSTKEIAGYLDISPNTARNIKSKLFEKYQVSNSIELLNATGMTN